MDFSSLLRQATFDQGILRSPIPESWAQGRTAYGGLTMALCAEAADRAVPDLPPLRSAQIAFVGPAAGEATVEARVLRQGKSTTFIGADLTAEAGLAARATIVFGARRESGITLQNRPIPDLPSHRDLESMPRDERKPRFIGNFEMRVASGGAPFYGQGDPEMTWWVRHREEAVRTTEKGLLALGDVTPPAVAPLMKGPAPVSSVTWHIDMLTDDLSTEDGWYLVHTRADAGAHGWSGQDMAIWSSDGRPIMGARQSVLVFA